MVVPKIVMEFWFKCLYCGTKRRSHDKECENCGSFKCKNVTIVTK